jgi:hypothetical protein
LAVFYLIRGTCLLIDNPQLQFTFNIIFVYRCHESIKKFIFFVFMKFMLGQGAVFKRMKWVTLIK